MSYTIAVNYEFQGADLYALLFGSDGDCWDGSNFIAFDGVNDNFDIPLTEDTNRPGYYYYIGNLDLEPGTYDEEVWEQVGGSPDRSADTRIGVLESFWTGGSRYPFEDQAFRNLNGSVRDVYRLKTPRGKPIAGVFIEITADEQGDNVVATGTTDPNGNCPFWLDPGNYYVFRRKAGYDFDNPDYWTIVTPY